MGSQFGGLTEGLYASIENTRKEERDREEAASKREAAILTTLADSDDPEIRSMAVAGMLEMANPKRRAKGLRGFLGEMEQSQTLPKIRQLLDTPVATEVRKPGLPSRGVPVTTAMRGPQLGAPPTRPGSAAMPAQSPVTSPPPPPQSFDDSTGGFDADPLRPGQQINGIAGQITLGRGADGFTTQTPTPGGPPPAPGRDAFTEQRATPTVTTTEMRPRQVFLDPAERMRKNTIAREQAEVEGEVEGYVAAGMSREEALALVKQSRIKRGMGGTGGVGEGDVVPDPQSSTGYSRVLYDRYTGQEVGRTPAMDPRRTGRVADLGDAVEMAAKRLGYNTSAEVPIERSEELHQMARKVREEMSQSGALGGGLGRAEAPLTLDQKLGHTRALQGAWFRIQQPVLATRRALTSLRAGMQAVERGDLAAGSEAVIVTFEKILDSLSVVRESEYLRPLYNQSLYDRAYGLWQKVKEGGAGLTSEQLKSYARLAEEIGGNVEAMVEPSKQILRNTASTYGLDPALVIGAEESQAGTAPPPPPGAPTTPGAAAPPPAAAGKTATMAQIRAFAAAKGITEQQAIAKAQADGFSITDLPR